MGFLKKGGQDIFVIIGQNMLSFKMLGNIRSSNCE